MNRPYNFYHHASKNPPSHCKFEDLALPLHSPSPLTNVKAKKKTHIYNVHGIGDGCLDLPNSLGHNFEHDNHFIPFRGTSKEELHKSNHY
jgi:hypothetical protein